MGWNCWSHVKYASTCPFGYRCHEGKPTRRLPRPVVPAVVASISLFVLSGRCWRIPNLHSKRWRDAYVFLQLQTDPRQVCKHARMLEALQARDDPRGGAVHRPRTTQFLRRRPESTQGYTKSHCSANRLWKHLWPDGGALRGATNEELPARAHHTVCAEAVKTSI